MIISRSRFAPEVDREKYRIAFPITDQIEPHMANAISCAWGLMENFTKIEIGLARTIVAGLSLDDPDRWREYARSIGKLFSSADQVSMLEDLVARGGLVLSDNRSCKMPREFETEELSYFEALRFSFEYRNDMAHNGVIFWIQENGGHFHHFPMIGLDNPRIANPSDRFVALDISSRAHINTADQTSSIGVQDWIFQLANRLPPYLGEPIVRPSGEKVDRDDFFESHKDRISKAIEARGVSTLKRIDKFIASLPN